MQTEYSMLPSCILYMRRSSVCRQHSKPQPFALALQMDPPPNGFVNWLTSPNFPYENPEKDSHFTYPLNLSQPQMSQDHQSSHNFFSAGYTPYYESPSNPKTNPRNNKLICGPGTTSETPRTAGNGQGDGGDDEENRGRRLSWTQEDNIRLVCTYFM